MRTTVRFFNAVSTPAPERDSGHEESSSENEAERGFNKIKVEDLPKSAQKKNRAYLARNGSPFRREGKLSSAVGSGSTPLKSALKSCMRPTLSKARQERNLLLQQDKENLGGSNYRYAEW